MTVKTTKVYPKIGNPLDKFTYGSRFGLVDSWHPNGHRGTDFIPTVKNATVKSIAAGTVTTAQWSAILGNVVEVKTAEGFIGYCHLAKVAVRKGQRVKIGSPIGIAGTTGSASTGVHVHVTYSKQNQGVFSGPVRNVREIIGTPDKGSTPTVEHVWAWKNPMSGIRMGIVKELVRLGYYRKGESQSITDKAHFVQAIERCLKDRIGFTGVINGEATWLTTVGIQDFGIKFAKYDKRYRDALLGDNSWLQFYNGLKTLKKK